MIRDLPTTTFFDTFTALARKKGLSPSRAVEELKMNRSVVTSWRKGRIPSTRTLDKLAEYFGVTRQYLLEGAPTESGSNNVDKAAPSVDIKSEPPTLDLELQKDTKVRHLSAKRSFINLAIHFLKYRYPEETTESLVAKLGMIPKTAELLNDDQVDTIPITDDWADKFYSLMDNPDYPSLLSDLNNIHFKLVRERRKANAIQAVNVISNYLYEQNITKFEFEKKPWIIPYRGQFISSVRLTEKCEQWLFLYLDCSKEYYYDEYTSFKTNFKDSVRYVFPYLYEVTRYYFMFTYTTNDGRNGDFSVIEEMATEEYKNIMARFQHVQFWILQIDGSTREITEERLLNTPDISSSKGTDESAPEEIGGQ